MLESNQKRGRTSVMKGRILLVEDFDEARSMMRYEIERLGHSVIEAANGMEAVANALSSRPDLILMDICMPGKDGLEATKEILEIETLRNIPIIAVTALGDTCGAQALELGCRDVLNKPIDTQSIGETIARHLQNS
jgi:two-component system, cell cycle response regulator DivK